MRTALAALIVSMVAGAAAADPGDVVYVRKGSLIRQPVLQKGEAVTLAELGPELAGVDRLAASPDGRTLVLSAGTTHRWLDLEAPSPTPRALICASPATPADRGVTCATGTGYTAVLEPRGAKRRVVDAHPAGARLVEGALIYADDREASRGIWKLDLASGSREQLSDHVPDAHLLIAPDGSRAVGVYGSGKTRFIDSFRLDGKAVRRKLLRGADPVAWSADSQWLLAQMKKRACILRAVGGQYKCWRRYRAVGIAPDGSWALVTRPRDDGTFDLFRAELAGPSARKPALVAESVAAGAVWLSRR